jgi:hypothetical protein
MNANAAAQARGPAEQGDTERSRVGIWLEDASPEGASLEEASLEEARGLRQAL